MGELIPAWLRPTKGEHRWPATVSVLVMIGLQVKVLSALHVRPGWVVPAFEALLLVVLLIANPGRLNRETTVLRYWKELVVENSDVAELGEHGVLHRENFSRM